MIGVLAAGGQLALGSIIGRRRGLAKGIGDAGGQVAGIAIGGAAAIGSRRPGGVVDGERAAGERAAVLAALPIAAIEAGMGHTDAVHAHQLVAVVVVAGIGGDGGRAEAAGGAGALMVPVGGGEKACARGRHPGLAF